MQPSSLILVYSLISRTMFVVIGGILVAIAIISLSLYGLFQYLIYQADANLNYETIISSSNSGVFEEREVFLNGSSIFFDSGRESLIDFHAIQYESGEFIGYKRISEKYFWIDGTYNDYLVKLTRGPDPQFVDVSPPLVYESPCSTDDYFWGACYWTAQWKLSSEESELYVDGWKIGSEAPGRFVVWRRKADD